jgi:hypothetical protein
MDPSELKSGEGIVELSEAVKQSGKYDPWGGGDEDVETEEVKDGMETVQPKKVKVRTYHVLSFCPYDLLTPYLPIASTNNETQGYDRRSCCRRAASRNLV